MKTIFTLLASLILSMSDFAAGAHPKSSLTIRSFDRGDIRVVIDGRRFEPNDNYVRIRSLDAGYHYVRIYREKSMGFIRIFGSRYEMVFNSSLAIRPFRDLMITIDRFGRTTVKENRSFGWYGHDDRGFGGNGNRYEQSNGNKEDKYYDKQNDQGFNKHGEKDFGDMDDRNWDNKHDFDFDRMSNYGDYNNGRDSRFGKDDRDFNNNGYKMTMNEIEFGRVLDNIQKEWFEDNKMKSATQIINTNYFTSAQVKQMLQLFSFENNKLELAKLAYTKTVDKQNYQYVSDVLTFRNSKEELARYIRDYH